MKRDMDFIRDLLLEIEGGKKRIICLSEEEAKVLGSEGDALPAFEAEKLEHHLWLLDDAGLVVFERTNFEWLPSNISWTGHDFFDSVRDPEIWKQTKEGAEKAGGFTVDILTALARGFIKEKVKKHTGIEIDI